MNTSRRTFIKNSSISPAGAAMLLCIILHVHKSTDHLPGIQLWTLRDYMEKDPSGTLKRLAEMGDKYVEDAGYQNRKFFGFSISDFKKLLGDNGLKMPTGLNFRGAASWNITNNDIIEEWK